MAHGSRLLDKFRTEVHPVCAEVEDRIISLVKAKRLESDDLHLMRKIAVDNLPRYEVDMPGFSKVLTLMGLRGGEAEVVGFIRMFTRKYGAFALNLLFADHPNRLEMDRLCSMVAAMPTTVIPHSRGTAVYQFDRFEVWKALDQTGASEIAAYADTFAQGMLSDDSRVEYVSVKSPAIVFMRVKG